MRCINCDKNGHKSTDSKCPESRKGSNIKKEKEETEYKKQHFDGTCFHCGKKGNTMIDCNIQKNKHKRNKKAEEEVEELDNLVLCSTFIEPKIKEKKT